MGPYCGHASTSPFFSFFLSFFLSLLFGGLAGALLSLVASKLADRRAREKLVGLITNSPPSPILQEKSGPAFLRTFVPPPPQNKPTHGRSGTQAVSVSVHP